MDESISVVMATYNGSKYVGEQLASILSQTKIPDEIVVIDDASTDGTPALVEGILAKSDIPYRVVVHAENKGVSKSFSDGIEEAASRWVMICDQDDVWHEEKIELMSAAISKDVKMVVCDAIVVDVDLRKTRESMFGYIKLPFVLERRFTKLSSCDMATLCLRRNYVTGMCMMGPKDLMEEAIPFPDTMTYDAWLAWNLANAGDTVFVRDRLVSYRQHDNNVIGTRRTYATPRAYFERRRVFLQSVCRKYESFGDVRINDNEVGALLVEGLSFHRKRSQFGTIRQSLNTVFQLERQGCYDKYTSDKFAELVKDIGMMILTKPCSQNI